MSVVMGRPPGGERGDIDGACTDGRSSPPSGPAAGRAVAFRRRERQPFIQPGISAAGAMSAWPDSAAEARADSKPGGAQRSARWRGVVGELELCRRRVRSEGRGHGLHEGLLPIGPVGLGPLLAARSRATSFHRTGGVDAQRLGGIAAHRPVATGRVALVADTAVRDRGLEGTALRSGRCRKVAAALRPAQRRRHLSVRLFPHIDPDHARLRVSRCVQACTVRVERDAAGSGVPAQSRTRRRTAAARQACRCGGRGHRRPNPPRQLSTDTRRTATGSEGVGRLEPHPKPGHDHRRSVTVQKSWTSTIHGSTNRWADCWCNGPFRSTSASGGD